MDEDKIVTIVCVIILAVPFIFGIVLPPIKRLCKFIAKVALYISLMKFLNRH